MRTRLFSPLHSRNLLLFVVVVLFAFGFTMVPNEGGRAVADPATSTAEALEGVTDIAVGTGHACALMAGGTVKCWGANGGRLGDGTTVNRLTPVDVVGLTGVTGLSTGSGQTCALMAGGTVKCWGDNKFGQLGDGTTVNRLTPVDVVDLTGVTGLSTGSGSHTCALMAGGTAKCWGYNSDGQLGDGTRGFRLTPVDVVGLSGAIALSTAAGGEHTCALMPGGTAKCWGRNYEGQLGDGTTTQRYSAVDVAGLSGATRLSPSGTHTCAVMASGTVKCWGDNLMGQLGDDTITDRYTAVDVAGISDAVSITAGLAHTCALMANGTGKCWGLNNFGQLGNGATVTMRIPVDVASFSGGVSITAAHYGTCALLSDGTVKCWGNNAFGQLGDGTTTDRYTPTPVLAVENTGGGDTDGGNPGGGDTEGDLCKPVNYLGVRGSGESPQGAIPSGSTYRSGIVNHGMGRPIDSQYTALRLMMESLGKADDLRGAGIVYRAIPVPDYLFDGDAYLQSLKEGAIKLRAELSAINQACNGKSTKIILAGYSQGADVIDTAAAAVQRENNTADFKNVASIVYLGHPSRVGGQLTELSDKTGTGVRRNAGAAVDPATDAWINNGHKALFNSICTSLDLVCDTSDNLALGATTVIAGGVIVGPLGAAKAAEIGIDRHTNYQTTRMNCAIPGAGTREVTTTMCGAAAIIAKLGYTVSSNIFTSSGNFNYPALKPASKATVAINGDPGKTYRLSIESDPIQLGTVVTDDNGIAAFEFTVPESLQEGDHHLIATSNSDNQRFVVPVRVSATAADQPGNVIVIGENDRTATTPIDPETPNPGGIGSLGSNGFGS